jgi:hypothetical protein
MVFTFKLILSGIVPGSATPGIVRRVSSHLFTYLLNIGFLGSKLRRKCRKSAILFQKYSQIVPTGADFIFFFEHPISSSRLKTGMKSYKINLFINIFSHFIQHASY